MSAIPRSFILLGVLSTNDNPFKATSIQVTGAAVAIAVNTGTLYGGGFGFSGTASGASFVGGNLTAGGSFYAPNGTAGAPSYSFTSDPASGFYYTANAINVSIGGTQQLSMQNGGYLQGYTNKGFLQLNSTGGIALTSGGTNQSITLTTSGNGITSAVHTTGYFQASATSGREIAYFSATGANAVNMVIKNDGSSSKQFAFNADGASFASSPLIINLNSGGANLLLVNGHALFGGQTADGTGVLQLPAGAADATSGITWATDTQLFRNAAGSLRLNATGTATLFEIGAGGTRRGYLSWDNTNFYLVAPFNPLILQSNGATALTLDSSQNGTLVGNWNMTGTKQIIFGATAQAKIGVSADATSGNVVFNGTTTGIFTFDKAIRGNGGFQGSAGTAGLTQASTSTTAKSITVENGLVTAFA